MTFQTLPHCPADYSTHLMAHLRVEPKALGALLGKPTERNIDGKVRRFYVLQGPEGRVAIWDYKYNRNPWPAAIPLDLSFHGENPAAIRAFSQWLGTHKVAHEITRL